MNGDMYKFIFVIIFDTNDEHNELNISIKLNEL